MSGFMVVHRRKIVSNPFWGPSLKAKPLKSFGFVPVKLNTRANVRNIKRRDLTYPQALLRYPKMKAFGDSDRDGKLNMFDCRPFDKKRHGWAEKGINFNRERSTHIKMMSPDKFLRTTRVEAENRGRVNYESQEDFEDKVIDKKNVTKLKKAIENRQDKVDIPFLEYDEQGRPTGHEGRHRAVASRELGIKLIPVTIAKKLNEPRDWKHMRETWSYRKTKHDYRNDLENSDEISSSKSADISIDDQTEYGKAKPQAIRAMEGEDLRRDINETDFNKGFRLRHGMTKIKTIDAAEFKKKYEEQHGEKLDWNSDRLKHALERNEDDAYPEVYIGKDKIDVSDGRHRISAAASRGQKIDVAYDDDEDSADDLHYKFGEDGKILIPRSIQMDLEEEKRDADK